MAQHDYVIENQSAPAFRADLNSALAAAVSQNSGPTAPVVMFADMIWYDTANNQIKKRNEANSAWITLGTIDETLGTFTPNAQITTSQVNPTTLVTAAETIAANNNDTTIPTSAAVKSYTDTALAGAASVTLLATLATTSGTTVTSSGLNLTSYRFLRIVINGVGTTTASFGLNLSLNSCFFFGDGTSNAGPTLSNTRGFVEVDLATGVGFSHVAFVSAAAPSSVSITGSQSAPISRDTRTLRTTVTTATTSISIAIPAGGGSVFNAGSISIYGVR